MRGGIAAAIAVVAFGLSAGAAQASFHLMKITEVGQGGSTQSDFVELQMYAAGQGFVGGTRLQMYDQTGALQDTFTFPSGVPNGDSQRTILVWRDEQPPPPAVVPDFTSPDLVLRNQGAVCFGLAFGLGQAVDCVAYGAFAGFAGPAPSPVGSPAPAPGPGQSISRTIAPGCSTLLEAGDDSDDSATDFAVGSPSPRGNTVTPAERSCAAPDTSIVKGPKKRTRKTKAKFRFRASESGSAFECKLDKRRYEPCTSPQVYKRLKRGKHRFRVRATDADGNTDPTPAKHRWKITP